MMEFFFLLIFEFLLKFAKTKDKAYKRKTKILGNFFKNYRFYIPFRSSFLVFPLTIIWFSFPFNSEIFRRSSVNGQEVVGKFFRNHLTKFTKAAQISFFITIINISYRELNSFWFHQWYLWNFQNWHQKVRKWRRSDLMT